MKSEIERQVAFYRGYLIDDRSLEPLTVGLWRQLSLSGFSSTWPIASAWWQTPTAEHGA